MPDNVPTKNADKIFLCDCGKEYKHRQSLAVHKKICKKIETCQEKEEPSFSDKDIIKMLLKDNSELKAMILEVVKSVQPNTTNNSTNNSNNTTNNNFNLQIYLNELIQHLSD